MKEEKIDIDKLKKILNERYGKKKGEKNHERKNN